MNWAKCWYEKEELHHKPSGTPLDETKEERCIQQKGYGMSINKLTQLSNIQ
jgi:hypothetical protein